MVLFQIVMPHQKRFFLTWTHSVRVVIRARRYGSNILLVLLFVEQVGKVTLCQFVNAKGFGKVSQPHRYETQRIDELDVEHLDKYAEDLGTTHDDFWNNTVRVQILLNEITVVALEIVCHHDTICMFVCE